jgi:hypothetical protein
MPIDPTSLPPSEGLPPLQIGAVEHLHLSYGTNAQTTSTSSRTGSPTVATQSNFFSRQMGHHGPGYWGFHFVLAFFATAIYELLAWLLFSSPH